MTYYVHNVPGRLRVTVPAIKGNNFLCLDLEGQIGGMHGVKDVLVKPVTGSIVVTYDENLISKNDILAVLQDRGLFDPRLARDKRSDSELAGQKAGYAVCRAAIGWAVGKALEGNGLSFLAAFI